MSVSFNSELTSANLNNAFASKSNDNTLSGQITLSHADSGATINDVQQLLNNINDDFVSLTNANTLSGDQTITGEVVLNNSGSGNQVSNLQQTINTMLSDISTLQSSGGGGGGGGSVYTFTNQTALDSYTPTRGDIVFLNDFEFDFTSTGSNQDLNGNIIFVNLAGTTGEALTSKFKDLINCNVYILGTDSSDTVYVGGMLNSSIRVYNSGSDEVVIRLGQISSDHLRSSEIVGFPLAIEIHDNAVNIQSCNISCDYFYINGVNCGIERTKLVTKEILNKSIANDAFSIVDNSDVKTGKWFTDNRVIISDSLFHADKGVSSSTSDKYNSTDTPNRYIYINSDLSSPSYLFNAFVGNDNFESLSFKNNHLYADDYVLVYNNQSHEIVKGRKYLIIADQDTNYAGDYRYNNIITVVDDSKNKYLTFTGTIQGCEIHTHNNRTEFENNPSIKDTNFKITGEVSFTSTELRKCKIDSSSTVGSGTAHNKIFFTDVNSTNLEVNGDDVVITQESTATRDNTWFHSKIDCWELEYNGNSATYDHTFAYSNIRARQLDINSNYEDRLRFSVCEGYSYRWITSDRFIVMDSTRFAIANTSSGNFKIRNAALATDSIINKDFGGGVVQPQGFLEILPSNSFSFLEEGVGSSKTTRSVVMFMQDLSTPLTFNWVVTSGFIALQPPYWSPVDSSSTTRCQFADSVNNDSDSFSVEVSRSDGSSNYITTNFTGKIEIEVSYLKAANMVAGGSNLPNSDIETRIKRVDSSSTESWVLNGAILCNQAITDYTQGISFDSGTTSTNVHVYEKAGRYQKITTECTTGDKFSLHTDTGGYLGLGGTRGALLHPYMKITRLE